MPRRQTNCKKWRDFNEIRYSEAFEVADYPSNLETQKGESCLIHKCKKWLGLYEILYLRVSKIADYASDLEIRNSKSRMQCVRPKYNKQLVNFKVFEFVDSKSDLKYSN